MRHEQQRYLEKNERGLHPYLQREEVGYGRKRRMKHNSAVARAFDF